VIVSVALLLSEHKSSKIDGLRKKRKKRGQSKKIKTQQLIKITKPKISKHQQHSKKQKQT